MYNCFLKSKPTKNSTPHTQSGIEQMALLILIVISINLVSISILVVFFHDSKQSDNEELVGIVREMSAFVLYSVLLSFSISILFILYKRRSNKQISYLNDGGGDDDGDGRGAGVVHKKSQNVEKQIDYVFLVLSNLCVFIYHTLTLIGYSNSFSKKFKYFPEWLKPLEIIFSIVPFIESTIQLFILWSCEHKVKLDKQYIQILALTNFSVYVFETFSAVNKGAYEMQKSFYSQNAWEILGLVFLPLAIFYRFHSCIILIKIKSHKYQNELE